MDEKAMIEKIVESFKDKTKEYSDKLNALSYDTETYYIKNDKEKGYNFIDASIEFKDLFLKMEYKVHTSMLLPTSTLEMRILFKGSKFPIEYSIYDLLNIIDETNFNCYTIPYITSTETMEKALDYLLDVFEKYKERISDLLHNDEKFNKLEENVREQIAKLLGGNLFKSINPEYIAHMLEVYYVLDAARFTTEIYANYVLQGKYKQAIKAYSRTKYKTTIYEERLKEYLSTLKEPVSILPKELETIKTAKKYQKVGFKQSLLIGLSFLILTPAWAVLYGLIYMVSHNYITKELIYISNSEWPIILLLGFVTAIANMFFTRKLIAKLIYKEKYEEYKMFDMVANSESVNNFMTKFFQFIIAACIAFSMLAANTYIGFTYNNIVLNDGYFNLKGEEIPYEKVHSVYKTEKLADEIIGEIENTNYIIVLKDNTKIELYWFITNEEVETNVLPIFKEKGIEIKTIDLITNIPDVEEIKQDENID